MVLLKSRKAGKMLPDRGFQVIWVREGLITLSEGVGPKRGSLLCDVKPDIIAIWECLGAAWWGTGRRAQTEAHSVSSNQSLLIIKKKKIETEKKSKCESFGFAIASIWLVLSAEGEKTGFRRRMCGLKRLWTMMSCIVGAINCKYLSSWTAETLLCHLGAIALTRSPTTPLHDILPTCQWHLFMSLNVSAGRKSTCVSSDGSLFQVLTLQQPPRGSDL